MSRRMKVLVSVLVAILLLTVVGTATALADEGSTATDNETGRNGLLARVAEILGIPGEDLTDAFKQAQQEMMEERWKEAFYRALDKAVEEELITPEEAEEIRGWWEQKPETLNLGLLRRAFSLIEPHVKNMPGARRGMRPEIMPQPGQGMNGEQQQPGPPWRQGVNGEWQRPGPPWRQGTNGGWHQPEPSWLTY